MMARMMIRTAWRQYSAMPNENQLTYSDTFRYVRYAGATTIDMPKSAFSMKAVPSASVIIPMTYAISV